MAVSTSDTGAVAVTIPPGMINLVAHTVDITATSPAGGEVTLVVGREPDITGWLGGLPYQQITGFTTWEELSSAHIAGEQSAAGGIDPRGSDMWLQTWSGTGSVTVNWDDGAGNLAFLASSPGAGATPTITMTWPRTVEDHYTWPLVAGGLATILLGGAIMLSRGRLREAEAPVEPMLKPNWPSISEVVAQAPEPELVEEPAIVVAEEPARVVAVVPEAGLVKPKHSAIASKFVFEKGGRRRRRELTAEQPIVAAEIAAGEREEKASSASHIEPIRSTVARPKPVVREPRTIASDTYVPPVSRSELRAARVVAEETGNTELLEALTGAIRAVPAPGAVTSQIPVQAASWRSTWGLTDSQDAEEQVDKEAGE